MAITSKFPSLCHRALCICLSMPLLLTQPVDNSVLPSVTACADSRSARGESLKPSQAFLEHAQSFGNFYSLLHGYGLSQKGV